MPGPGWVQWPGEAAKYRPREKNVPNGADLLQEMGSTCNLSISFVSIEILSIPDADTV